MNRLLPAGRLAERLDSISREQVWFLIVVATASIACLEYTILATGSAPLHMLIICGACWGLGAREGYFVALIAAILGIIPSLQSTLPSEWLALRAAISVTTFLFIAAIITSFRRSYDRELFLAHRDRMTGALNKEAFHRRSIKAIADAAHTGQTWLLILLDLDDFKAVNSREGHRAGDEVLRTLALGALSIMGKEDLIGRIGGDEFSLLVRVPSIAEGQDFACDLHARLSVVLAHSRHHVTCSMGALLILSDESRSFSELMHAADQAMYCAKHTGKNAVRVARAW